MVHPEPIRREGPEPSDEGREPRGAPAEAAPAEVSEAELARAREVADRTRHELLATLLEQPEPPTLQALNNALMDTFRAYRSVEAFSLLFDLNMRPFTAVALRLMGMLGCRADVNDILQEAFLSIYRYPSRFSPRSTNAFRNWSYSIIRNTIYRHGQKDRREGVPVDSLAETLEDEAGESPLRASLRSESGQDCRRTYVLLLWLYMEIYERELKPRDREALYLVEVEELGYREAAERLGIRLENFKMVVCRARKKIFQSLVRILGTRQL